jgi:UDP-glucuronate 4-epimerase
MKVLVTGAAGFIGFHLSKELLNLGFKVVGLDSINDYYSVDLKFDRLKSLGINNINNDNVVYKNGDFTFIYGDISDDIVWNEYVKNENITHIIHLAAQAGVRYSLDNPKAYIKSNIDGFLNVLEYCRFNSINHLIYASSSSVYGVNSVQPFSESERCDQPISLYAATKRSNELMAHTYFHLYGIKSIGLRFFTVYGPWGRPDMAPMLFTSAAFENREIKVFNHGDQSRDFTYIDDIIGGIVALFEQKETKIESSDVCNIGNGNPVNLLDFINSIEKHTNIEITKDYVNAQPGDVSVTYANTSKLASLVGYKAKTNIDEGVYQFIKWYKSYYNIN